MRTKSIKSDTYKEAGVDIDLAHKLLNRVKSKISKASRPEMLAPIGGFGGLFKLDLSKYKEPILVSSIDGIGTKLMVSRMMNKFDGLGYDIVNHCVNDIGVQGAEPLYFLDYIGIGKLRSPLYEEILCSMADACRESGCALLGGETAEMPGMYGDDCDVVGVITGVVEKSKLITGKEICPGYKAVGIASSGLHTNGYSLARRVLFQQCGYDVDTELKELGCSIGEALLKPHTSYWPAIKKAMGKLPLHGIAHITGGGLYENVPRILPDNVDVVFTAGRLPVSPIFTLIVEEGNIQMEEAYRVFNMGIGMVWFLPAKDADKAVALCESLNYKAAVIGEVIKGKRKVFVE